MLWTSPAHLMQESGSPQASPGRLTALFVLDLLLRICVFESSFCSPPLPSRYVTPYIPSSFSPSGLFKFVSVPSRVCPCCAARILELSGPGPSGGSDRNDQPLAITNS